METRRETRRRQSIVRKCKVDNPGMKNGEIAERCGEDVSFVWHTLNPRARGEYKGNHRKMDQEVIDLTGLDRTPAPVGVPFAKEKCLHTAESPCAGVLKAEKVPLCLECRRALGFR